jgi:hypothetical protein
VIHCFCSTLPPHIVEKADIALLAQLNSKASRLAQAEKQAFSATLLSVLSYTALPRPAHLALSTTWTNVPVDHLFQSHHEY